MPVLIGLMGCCHNFCINWIHSKKEQNVLKNNSRLISALKERDCSIDEDCEVRMPTCKSCRRQTQKIQKRYRKIFVPLQKLLTGDMCCYDFSSPQGWQVFSTPERSRARTNFIREGGETLPKPVNSFKSKTSL